MPTDKELMQQAADALEEAQDYTSCPTYSPSMTQQCAIAAVAIRARLKQNDFNPDWDAIAVMVEEQQRMAKRIEELEAQLAQPEPEPVAWIKKDRSSIEVSIMSAEYMMREGFEPLYTAPPQREWVGLTDEEINYAWRMGEANIGESNFEFCYRAIEAKLKEKNT